MLVEPAFFCIPLGYLSFGTSFFTAIYYLLRKKSKLNKAS
ncbi:DUF3955 domain-containing protein [Enterococcus sp. SMC-9]|nr:DUF3955 domain-containing protein [Enterococcus sp. SMC-9]